MLSNIAVTTSVLHMIGFVLKKIADHSGSIPPSIVSLIWTNHRRARVSIGYLSDTWLAGCWRTAHGRIFWDAILWIYRLVSYGLLVGLNWRIKTIGIRRRHPERSSHCPQLVGLGSGSGLHYIATY